MHFNKSTYNFFSGISSKAFAISLLLSLVWLLIVRASFNLQSGIWPNPIVALLSDLVGAFLLAVLLCFTSGLVRGVFIGLLGVACFVASIHLSVHGTLFRLALIGRAFDPTFAVGSLATAHSLLLPAYLAFAWLLHCVHRSLVTTLLPARGGLLVCAVVAVLVYMQAFQSLTTPGNNVVASSLAQVPATVLAPVSVAVGSTFEEPGMEMTHSPFFHKRVAAPDIAVSPNVLLIMIEGLSGGYFPEVSAFHGLEPTVTLESLERRLNEYGFRTYLNALSMERQTDRGTFAILCGAYPNMHRQSTKMTDVIEGRARVDCLPEQLRKAGYFTAYWQAAPLEYMGKQRFMPLIGFEDVTGADAFSTHEDAVGWGPPDRVYFENIGERIRQLGEEKQPWMVTLLNVGTHHPFDIGSDTDAKQLEPDTTPIAAPQTARRQAMSVMEQSLEALLDELHSAGILDDTLVILTSDESGGFVRPDHQRLPLDNNIGALAIRPPTYGSVDDFVEREQLVAQIDISLTILDAVGLGEQSGGMIGRSLMVDTDVPRDLMVADTYTGMMYFLRETGHLMACAELSARCTTWRFHPERIFGSLAQTNDPPFLNLRERMTLIERANDIEPIQ